MTRVIVILLVALVFEAVGVVLLSRGLKEIGAGERMTLSELARVIRKGAANPSILTGVALEALFFGALLYLLSQRDVSLIWPLTSLGFVLTAVAAKFLLNEQIHWTRWLGVGLIVLGATFVTHSERLKVQRPVLPRSTEPPAGPVNPDASR
jgi:uncharacterized membrane protein